LILLSLATILIGNLFALRQDNLKRFLAFSSIAQVGFILIGISGSSQQGFSSLVYFIIIYVFSNLAAFGVISLVSAVTGKENINDFKGFYKNNPILSWVLTIALFSLAGVPPTAGFFGKLYLKVVKAIFMDENEAPMQTIAIPTYPKVAMLICVAGIILTSFVTFIYDYIQSLSISL
jgi:NADH-quinone oxidoreductase subunit N